MVEIIKKNLVVWWRINNSINENLEETAPKEDIYWNTSGSILLCINSSSNTSLTFSHVLELFLVLLFFTVCFSFLGSNVNQKQGYITVLLLTTQKALLCRKKTKPQRPILTRIPTTYSFVHLLETCGWCRYLIASTLICPWKGSSLFLPPQCSTQSLKRPCEICWDYRGREKLPETRWRHLLHAWG